MEEKQSIFRKQSLDRVSSPEELDQYLMVTGPGIWMTLTAIIVILVGVIFWMIFGRLNTTVNIAVATEDGQTVCYVPAEQAEAVLNSGKIKISQTEYTVYDIGSAPTIVSPDIDVNYLLASGLEVGMIVQPLMVDASLPDGYYIGQVVVETINPIKFIIN